MSDFHQYFRKSISTLQHSLDESSEPGISAIDQKSRNDELVADIAKLSADLADASNELPSYDQRSYSQALRELQDKLASTRASLAPKPKFSFKNKRLINASPAPDSASTSRSVTPSHLREPTDQSTDAPIPALASPPAHLVLSRDSSLTPSEREDAPQPDDAHDRSQFVIKDRSNAYIHLSSSLDLLSETTSIQGCVISDISSSIVNLRSDSTIDISPPFLTLNDITFSLILVPRVTGPAHMTGLSNSVLVLSCQQFRMHESHNVDIYLFCRSRPIIEDCSKLRFTTIPESLLGLLGRDSDDLEKGTNMFDQVDDFKWLRAEPSPNWNLMQDREGVGEKWKDVVEELNSLGVGEDSEMEKPDMVRRILRHSGVQDVS